MSSMNIGSHFIWDCTHYKNSGLLHPDVSLSQVGILPFHCPSAWHVLSAGPFSVYPVSHEYLATAPTEMLWLVFTLPLLGSLS